MMLLFDDEVDQVVDVEVVDLEVANIEMINE
jgi:hypothetical protein